MTALLDRLLRDAPEPHAAESFAAWWPKHRAGAAALATIDAAVLAGFRADRVAFAFAGGYEAALRALVPSLGVDRVAALAASEAGGAHPSAIATTLARDGDAFVLRGAKTWITLADAADTLLVVASASRSEGRNHLAVARVDPRAPGVQVKPMPPAPFVPEIAHAEVAFDGARVAASDVLPGDGYDAYLKPFRTIEDLHVHGALLGYLVGVARRSGWPDATIEELVALIVATAALAPSDARAPSVHVALSGLLAATRRAIDACDAHWPRAGEEERARWARDRALLSVAQKARTLRTEAAWRALRSP